MSCWFLSLLILFCIIGWLMGHLCPCSLCFWACPAELSQSQPGLAAHPENPRVLESPDILLQFSPRAPQWFSYLWGLGWTSSFLCFVRSKACPFMGLGPFLWALNGFGSSLFLLKARIFSRFQSFVLFWTLIQHRHILDLNNFLHPIS